MYLHETMESIIKEEMIWKIVSKAVEDTYQVRQIGDRPVVISIVIKYKGAYMLCNLSGVDNKFEVYPMRDREYIFFSDSLWQKENCKEITLPVLIDCTSDFLRFCMTVDEEDEDDENI